MIKLFVLFHGLSAIAPCSAVVVGGYYAYEHIVETLIDKTETDNFKEYPSNHLSRLSTWKDRLAAEKLSLKQATSDRASLLGKLKDLNDLKTISQKQIDYFENKISDLSTSIPLYEEALDKSIMDLSNNNQELQALNTQLNQLLNTEIEKESYFNIAKQSKDDHESEIARLIAIKDKAKSDDISATKDISSKEVELQELKSKQEAQTIQETKASQELSGAEVAYNKADKALNEHINNKELVVKEKLEAKDKKIQKLNAKREKKIAAKTSINQKKTSANNRATIARNACLATLLQFKSSNGNGTCQTPPTDKTQEHPDVKKARTHYESIKQLVEQTTIQLNTNNQALEGVELQLKQAKQTKEQLIQSLKETQEKTKALVQLREIALTIKTEKSSAFQLVQRLGHLLKQEHETKKKDLAAQQKRLDLIKSAIGFIDSRLTNLQNKTSNIDETYFNAQTDLSEFQNKRKDKQKGIDDLSKTTQELSKSVDKQTEDLNAQKDLQEESIKNLSKEIDKLKVIEESIPLTIKLIEEKTSQLNSLTNELTEIKTHIQFHKSEIYKSQHMAQKQEPKETNQLSV